MEAELFDDVWGSPRVLLQTDGANPTPHIRPGKRWEVEGWKPEEGEDLMTGWVTVQGKKECQVETETEEMETPQARRKLNPVPSPPPRVVAGRARWWRMDLEEQRRMENEWRRRWKKGGDWKAGIDRREVERLEQEWERKWRESG